MISRKFENGKPKFPVWEFATVAVSLSACWLLLFTGISPTTALKCSRNGAFKPNGTEITECKNCDFYYCIFYPRLNTWFVYPQNCSSNLAGNDTWVYSFDETSRRCTLNQTATDLNAKG